LWQGQKIVIERGYFLKKLKIYLDTSVISFMYADDSPEKQSITKEFFKKYLFVYDVHISDLVLTEIENTRNATLRKKLIKVIKEYDLKTFEIAPKDQQPVFNLAHKYIEDGVIPSRKFDDAVHVAMCVHYEFDILLSWNFLHLANINKQIRINAVNKKEGYLKELFLLSPMEVLYEEEK
jgi:predicted nucleic acid-binding protein